MTTNTNRIPGTIVRRIYSSVNTEIGQIIVASVNSQRIAELLNPDRAALRQLIEKKQLVGSARISISKGGEHEAERSERTERESQTG